MSVLGYNPFVDPQSPATPISTNFLRDEFDAVDTIEKDATGEQRVIAIGSSIPIVFCKFADNSGGTWISPPAARYGLQLSDTLDNSFALGLVISEGQIGAIDTADIYKGAFKLSDLSSTGVENAYGYMPETGFDYSFTNTITDPGSPGTPDQEVTEVIEYTDAQTGSASWNTSSFSLAFTYTVSSSISFGIRVYSSSSSSAVSLPFHYRVSTSTATVGEETPVPADTNYAFSHSNSGNNTTYYVRIKRPPDLGSVPSRVTVKLSPFLRTRHTTAIIPGDPAVPPTYTTVGLPLSPGSGGSFAEMSCLAVKGTYTQEAAVGDYREQIRCFVRNGIKVKNLATDVIESSSNFIDLAYYLLKANKVADELIDVDNFKTVRNFLEVNKLRFNGAIANAVNLRQFFSAVAPGLLLRFVQNSGKFSFEPVLPVSSNGYIYDGTIEPVKTFQANNIIPGTLSKTYFDSYLRKPICVLLSWREQFNQTFSVAVTTEIRYANSALEGPFEAYDFSDFITDINHATLVGKYILSSRARTTHSVRFSTFYDSSTEDAKLAAELKPMDVVRINFASSASSTGEFSIDGYYQVSSISESSDGNIEIEAVHFPIDETGVSLIAADVIGGAYAVT